MFEALSIYFLGVHLNDAKVLDILECLRDARSNVKDIIMSREQFTNIKVRYFKDLWEYVVANYNLYFLNVVDGSDLQDYFTKIDTDNDGTISEIEFNGKNLYFCLL